MFKLVVACIEDIAMQLGGGWWELMKRALTGPSKMRKTHWRLQRETRKTGTSVAGTDGDQVLFW